MNRGFPRGAVHFPAHNTAIAAVFPDWQRATLRASAYGLQPTANELDTPAAVSKMTAQ